MSAPQRSTWTVYRATVLMALGLAGCALITSAVEHAGAHHDPAPPAVSTAPATGACAAPRHSGHPGAPETLRMVNCRDHAARFEILRIVPGTDPASCLGVPGAELAFAQPATHHHPTTVVCVTLLDVQSRGPQE